MLDWASGPIVRPWKEHLAHRHCTHRTQSSSFMIWDDPIRIISLALIHRRSCYTLTSTLPLQPYILNKLINMKGIILFLSGRVFVASLKGFGGWWVVSEKSFHRKDWETRTENWTTPKHTSVTPDFKDAPNDISMVCLLLYPVVL